MVIPNKPKTERTKKREDTVLRRFLKHKLAVVGFVIMIVLVIMAVLAPLLAPYDPYMIQEEFEAAPSARHILGTDSLGRDVLSRLIYASQVSLVVGIGSVFISVCLGVVLGLVSGYFGGAVDMVIMRLADIFMSFPQMMLVMVAVSVVGPGMKNLIIVMGVLGWPGVARLTRGQVLSLKQRDYVRSCIALGYGVPRILFQHILPNAIDPIIVNATFSIASAILTEASLSFLGLGVQPPTASWGNMLSDAQSLSVLASKLWMWIPPGLMIMLNVLSINFIGDGLRDANDPNSIR